MFEALRGYAMLAVGVTELVARRVADQLRPLLPDGVENLRPDKVAGRAADHVGDVAGDLLATSKLGREVITGLVGTEIDRAVGRMGFVREEELAALRRHVQRLEAQVGELRGESPDTDPDNTSPDPVAETDDPAWRPPVRTVPAARSAPADEATDAATTDATATATASAANDVAATDSAATDSAPTPPLPSDLPPAHPLPVDGPPQS